MTKNARTREFYEWLDSRATFTVLDRINREIRRRTDKVRKTIRPMLRGYKEEDKVDIASRIAVAGVAAYSQYGVIRYSRSSAKIFLQAVEAMVSAGFFIEYRAPSGWSEMQSRLEPTAKLWASVKHAPPPKRYNVELRTRRATGKPSRPIEFDRSEAFPLQVHEQLALVNRVNAAHTFMFRPGGRSDEVARAITLTHVAKFTERWDWGGRIYAEHQNLPRDSRLDIRIDGEPTVELDYGSMHPRMLYHREGLDCPEDLYKLWGDGTTKFQRKLAKKAVNTFINAKSEACAIESCVRACMLRTPGKKGRWKSGGKRHEAEVLREALIEIKLANAAREGVILDRDEIELTRDQIKPIWKEVFGLIKRIHAPILHRFAKDAGLRTLMPLEGKIALSVLHHLASQGIPCLGVHDSFIVAEKHEEKLWEAMDSFYRYHVGTEFAPKIDKKDKPGEPTLQPHTRRKAA